ncbi:MAG: T9SS type A sorting domain-containing protein [Bacteroidota bacterium]|nr:T9SS type A sorting domain-containing protein [Bacteroidota bacterium]
MCKLSLSTLVLLFTSTFLGAQSLQLNSAFGNNGTSILPNESLHKLTFSSRMITQNKNVFTAISNMKVRSIYEFSVYKTLENGKIDSSFGSNGKSGLFENTGLPILNIENSAKVISIAESQNNDIYILLQVLNKSAAIVKMKENGMIDSAFGVNGLVDFQINDFNTQPKNLSFENGNIYISGHYNDSNVQKIFIKSFSENGQEHLLKSNKKHLEIFEPQANIIYAFSHQVEFPFIYIAGNIFENNLSKFYVKKIHLKESSISDLTNKFQINNWQSHVFNKIKLINQSLYLMGSISRNVNKEYTSLIAKLDKNLTLDKSFNNMGFKVSSIYNDRVNYFDFDVLSDKLYVFGRRRNSSIIPEISIVNFIGCMSLNGDDINGFGENSLIYLKSLTTKVKDVETPIKILISSDSTFNLSFLSDQLLMQQYHLNFKTSIESETNQNKLIVYPNPTNTYLNFNNELEIVKLYDVRGLLLKTYTNINAIDLRDFTSGLYIIETIDNSNHQRFKILKN